MVVLAPCVKMFQGSIVYTSLSSPHPPTSSGNTYVCVHIQRCVSCPFGDSKFSVSNQRLTIRGKTRHLRGVLNWNAGCITPGYLREYAYSSTTLRTGQRTSRIVTCPLPTR
ncbi:hypothetical protein PISMIDRAFT_354863 [Pisolithus microcarpus 441]|uniref:Uncharacterized protein n=1 Tax=Pisolithus microcarpus 441 TaxID=765257 RepID=A0A0C9Z7C1_9AGAM|nr:hypothetical protein PISMIDRAFT_354863 [Pisolithus microcarpus 441]